jgi:hypothetical protein
MTFDLTPDADVRARGFTSYKRQIATEPPFVKAGCEERQMVGHVRDQQL